MQQFTIPQFIDVEDKIIGPITTRQFLIMVVCFISMAIYYKIFDFALFLTAAIVNLIIFGILAFVKINGRPFHFFILNLIQTAKRPNIRVWLKKILPIHDEDEGQALEKHAPIKRRRTPSVSRLTELSLIVDTQGMYQGEQGKIIRSKSIEALNKEDIKQASNIAF